MRENEQDFAIYRVSAEHVRMYKSIKTHIYVCIYIPYTRNSFII